MYGRPAISEGKRQRILFSDGLIKRQSKAKITNKPTN
jgi:hypothetical protein